MKKPETQIEWALYRCQSSCQIGRDVLDGKKAPPYGIAAIDYAVYCLLHAVEDLSIAVGEMQ